MSARPRVELVISGGQTGVDQAALRAALRLGIRIGGWCPPGRLCETGPIPACFPLVETPAERSLGATDVPRSLRTEWNVRDSDATLVVTVPGSPAYGPGTAWTVACAGRLAKPLLSLDLTAPAPVDAVRAWLSEHAVKVLNVAGPAESRVPGIGERAEDLLLRALDRGARLSG